MKGTMLRKALHNVLPADVIEQAVEKAHLVTRRMKLDAVALVRSLVLSMGSDDSGRLADAYELYLREADEEVVRGAFYGWLGDKLVRVMEALSQHALEVVRSERPVLEGPLAKRDDWLVVDSETVTLRDSLRETYPSTSKRAGLKVHNVYSLGRNNVVDYWVSPAREHDARHLEVDESMRGKGLIVDLAYASKRTLAACQRHGVGLVMRLKKGWKPTMRRLHGPDDSVDVDDLVLEGLVDLAPSTLDGATIDADVRVGRAAQGVEARLIGVPGPHKYHWYITLLPREEFSPHEVAAIYATRWNIELDNKQDKTGARLDQIRATTPSSVAILVHAAMIRTILANLLVHRALQQRASTEPPLHASALVLALAQMGPELADQLELDDPQRWDRLARVLWRRAQDPNWRGRPSQLDTLRGTCAPRGRPRRKRLADCPPSARAYRRVTATAA